MIDYDSTGPTLQLIGARFLARQASVGRLVLCRCYISFLFFLSCFLSFIHSFFLSFFLFNDRLEQRNFGNYETDLHKIFRGGIDMYRCSIWFWFLDRSRDVAMTTNFRREIGRNRRYAFPSWDSHSTTDGRIGKRMGALTAQKSCLHRIKHW